MHAIKDASARVWVNRIFFTITAGILLVIFAVPSPSAQGATGVPLILNHQGRLLNNSGTLLGGPSGTDYCFKFSIYDNATVGNGTKLWPAGTPSSMVVNVKNGVFNVGIGDTSAGGDTLNFNFEDNDTVFLNVQVATYSGTCGTFETLGPRQRIVSSAFAINAQTVRGFAPSQTPTANQIPVLTASGHLQLNATNPQLNATSSNTLTLQGGGGTGDIQFFSSSNKITSSGNLTIAGSLTLGNTSTITSGSTLAISSGGANTLSLDTGGAAALNIGATNANAVNISKTGVATTILGTSTFNEPITVGNASGNDYLGFAAEATNPSCAAGNYRIWVNSSDAKLKKCQNGSITDLDTGGGAQTPWTSAIDADGFALQDALNLEFRTAAGSAPGGTVISLYADNSGDLTANVLTGKTFNIAVNGTDEYTFSSSTLDLNSNTITNAGTINGLAITANTGVITTGTWQGTAVADTYVADTLTIDSSSSVHWNALNNYPAACAAGSAISQLADTTNTCTSFNTDTSITLQDAYNATSGNTITTTTGRNIAVVLAEVASPTSFTIENQDTGASYAQRIFSTISSGSIGAGIQIDEMGNGGTMSSAISITEYPGGNIVDGISITGTLDNILNSTSIDITGAGAITGATGFNGLIVTANTGVITTGTWNATAIGSQYGGTGQNWSATSGLPSLNSGTWSANAITPNGVAYGGASNAMSFTAQGGTNTVLVANAGAPSFSAAITVGTSVTSPSLVATTALTTPSIITSSGALGITPASGSNVNITLATTGDFVVNTDDLYVDTSSGNVGIGDASPNSLFTVGSGDLFQINSTGQIGSQQAPVSDYLFALAGTTGNDHSRIIDITQANNATENSRVISIVNTVNPGSSASEIQNIYASLTPTAATSSSTLGIFGTQQAIDISNTTLGPNVVVVNGLGVYGNEISITGTPVINESVSGAFASNHGVYGTSNTINITPTLTAAGNVNGIYIGNASSVGVTISVGDAQYNPSVYGEWVSVSGDLTTIGNSYHYGGYYAVAGTADINYGLYASVAGATTNYAAILTGGNSGFGTTAPDRALEINDASGNNLRLTYNDADGSATNYADLLTTSAGALTIQPSGFIANLGGGTTRTALRFLEPSGTGTDYAAIQANANVTTSYTWTLPAADASGCIQSNGSGALSISACGGGGYATIQDEAGNLTQRTVLNFTGAGVSCADNAGSSRTDCTINGGGSAALDTLTAATTDDTALLNADNTIEWNWALTSATSKGITLGESAASTGGSGDQHILRIDTASGSTAGALEIESNSADSGDIEFNLANSGDFNIQDNGLTFATFTDQGRVGIGTDTPLDLLQVGSAIQRGDLSVYGDITTKGLKDITALTGIKDVFVYDTTADSDGGRWIDWATTEKMSWYTETLDDGPGDACNISSDDRCDSAAFPRKAALIVTTSALYIFDANNNTMWMKFSQNASGYALGVDTNNDPSSVTALNGVIYVGMNGSAGTGLYAFDFTQDRMWNYDGTDRSGADVGIGSRNGVVTYNSDNQTVFDIATVGTVADWDNINDVDAAVIIRSATANSTTAGPQNGVTVVALATDAGLTVINLSTQKVLQYSDTANQDYNAVEVTSGAKLYGLNSTADQLEMWLNIDNENLATRVAGNPDKIWDEASVPPLSRSTPAISVGAPDALEVVEKGSLADGGVIATATVANSSDLIYVGTDQGLTEIHPSQTNQASGWSKFYDTSRQTPLMTGSIRRMHPMDDTSGAVVYNAAEAADVMSAEGTPTYGVDGVRGKAMSFNGTSQWLCSDSASDGTCENDTADNINTGSFTITVWFKHAASVTGVDTVFARCYNTTPAAATGCIALAMNASGQMVFTMDDDASWSVGAATNNDVTYTTTNQTFNDGQWHFAVMSKLNGATAPLFMIDGKVFSYATSLTHATMDNAQILGIGTDCSGAAACGSTTGTAGNLWEGQIDDFTYSACGTAACTTDGLSTTAALAVPLARRLYNDARPLVNKKTISVTDATTATSTTIGDSGEAWIPNEFAGAIVRLVTGTGAGQTRRIVSNTATVLTVSPAFTSTPDTTTDFTVDYEALFGSTNIVTAIGITSESPIGESRMMCTGTSNGSDDGAVTCYNHQAGPSVIADILHADGKIVDDSGAEWTGTDYDDIMSIDVSGRTMIFASQAHLYTEDQNMTLGQGLDYLGNKIFQIRSQLLTLGLTSLAGSNGIEVGLTGGADLAEYYYSKEPLSVGEVVMIDPNGDGDDILRSDKAYNSRVMGVVSTEPGITLGQRLETGVPVALTGRIPVMFSYENGPVKAGDYITSASKPGYAMRATGAGPVIGKALADSCYVKKPVEKDTASLSNAEADEITPSNEESANIEAVNNEESSQTAEAAASEAGASSAEASAENTSLTEAEILDIAEEVVPDCGRVIMFVELGDFSGMSVDELIAEMDASIIDEEADVVLDTEGLSEDGDLDLEEIAGLEPVEEFLETDEKILAFLIKIKMQKTEENIGVSAQIFTDRVSAAFEVITPSVTASGLKVDTIGKDGGNIDLLGDITFFGRPYFHTDTAGFAIIKSGKQEVEIVFEREYLEQPIVNASVTFDRLDLELDQEIRDQARLMEDLVLAGDLRYIVTDKSVKGFTIKLARPASADIQFSWIALAVKKPRIFMSKGDESLAPAVLGEHQDTIGGDYPYEVIRVEDNSSNEASESNNEPTIEENIKPDPVVVENNSESSVEVPAGTQSSPEPTSE